MKIYKKFTETFPIKDRIAIILLAIVSILIGILTSCLTQQKLGTLAAIVFGLLTITIGMCIDYIFAVNKFHLSALDRTLQSLMDKVDLQCKRDDMTSQKIATCLYNIIGIVNKGKKVETAFKRLNGVYGILSKEGPEGILIDTLGKLKERIENGECRFFIATSAANFGDWIDPEWSVYLTRQLIYTSNAKSNDGEFVAKRYFIYKREVFDITYRQEFEDLCRCHEDGKTNMYSLDIDIFRNRAKDVISELIEKTGDEKERTVFKRICEQILNADGFQQSIPDFIGVDTFFWFRDPSNNYRLKELPKSRVLEFKLWVKLLSEMQKYKISQFSVEI